VREKNTAPAMFSETPFRASVKHIEFKNPKIKDTENIVHFFLGFPSAMAAYLKPAFVNTLNKMASHNQEFVSIDFLINLQILCLYFQKSGFVLKKRYKTV